MPDMYSPAVVHLGLFAAKSASARDEFIANKDADTGKWVLTKTGKVLLIIAVTLYILLLGIPAAYLSWMANTVCNWGVLFKLLFAFMSMIFALEYLLCYAVFKHDLVTVARAMKMRLGMGGMGGIGGMGGMGF